MTTDSSRSERQFPDRAGDHRSEFQRDRDRVLYSAAFRRLAGVTQVFNAAEGTAFHNRLIHSLKVAQIARRLAELIRKETAPAVLTEVGGLDADVVETAALAHDLGHPPFGHAGESALNETMLSLGAHEGFEGNAQTFRILSRLSIRGFPGGLNLSRASLAATIKYPWLHGKGGKESEKKWGAYQADETAFRFARDQPHLRRTKRQAVEARVMEWADDVAYSVHDLDDAYRSGLIPLDVIIQDPNEWKRFYERCVADFWSGEVRVGWEIAAGFHSEILFLFSDSINRPFVGSPAQRAALDDLSAMLIRRFVGVREEVPLRIDRGRVVVDPTIKGELRLLKELMRFYVFQSPGLRSQQVGQQRLVTTLLKCFDDATKHGSKSRDIVASPFRERLEELAVRDKQARLRLACDVVASMTEQEALQMHARLTGSNPGSAMDFILR
ncbi:MAG: dNTP triphosphohydrolase [Myxococcales bacterium]|nr:dNTP triphosphohydrolase [Myxococcales bacterium]